MPIAVIGRASAVQAVTETLDQLGSRAAVLLVEGDPGIGKTTLWTYAIDQARGRGYRVLVCRAAAVEATLSYAALADLLAAVHPGILAQLPEPQRRAAETVLLRTSGDDGGTGPRAVGAALLSVLLLLAEQAPILLAVDDLQWVDVSSRRALDFAVRRMTSRMGVLTVTRAGDTVDELPVPADVVIRRIVLLPLDRPVLHRVLTERMGQRFASPVLARIHEVSGGNPFYALELARALAPGAPVKAAALPHSLSGLVRARIDGLDAAVRDALLVVAAVPDATVTVVAGALETSGEEIGRRLDVAERNGVLTMSGTRVRFAHPLLAAGVYAAAHPGDRRAIHRRLAAVVGEPEEQARHMALAAVADDPATVSALDVAAGLARARGAPAAAAELLRLAIGLGGDTAERHVRLAQQDLDSGEPDRARAGLEAVLPRIPPGPARASALLLLALVRLNDDGYRDSAIFLLQALQQVGDDLRLRVQVLVQLCFVLVNLGRIPEARELVDGAVERATSLGDPPLLAEALASSVMVRFLSGEGLDGVALSRALAEPDADLGIPVMLRPTLINGLLLSWTGKLEEGRRQMLAVRRACLEHGEESDLMFSAFHLVVLECWRGDLVGARLIAEDTMDRALQLGTDIPLAVALSVRATVASYAGPVDEARSAARGALQIFERGSCLAVTVWPLVTLGFLELSVGDLPAAVAVLQPLIGAAAGMGYGEPTAAPFAPDAAEALIGVGRLDEATRLVDRLEDNGRRLDRPWALALGGRCRSLLLAAAGDVEQAVDVAERAMAEHDRLPMPFERARTLLVPGRLNRRRRQKRAAAEALGEAVAEFDRLGTPLWAARARAELARAAVTTAGATNLTPSEHRVADLAGNGMTNREVAAALFISPKTVEANLARVYHKLGIRSRAELGRAMTGRRG